MQVNPCLRNLSYAMLAAKYLKKLLKKYLKIKNKYRNLHHRSVGINQIAKCYSIFLTIAICSKTYSEAIPSPWTAWTGVVLPSWGGFPLEVFLEEPPEEQNKERKERY